MMYALGLITGILLVLAILLVEQRNKTAYKPSKLVGSIQYLANRQQKGEVIIPLDEETERREKYIKQKHEAGLDVFIDEL